MREGVTDRQAILDMMGDESSLLFLAVEEPDGRVLVAVQPSYDDPAGFGLLVADLVGHVANAYASRGFDPVRVRASLLETLGKELDFPTDTPMAIKVARGVIPQG
jgi:hypothetical protein